jgi:hypothetical protein
LAAHDEADFLVPLLANKGSFCQLPKRKSTYCLMASGGFSLSVSGSGYDSDYLLGVLNSKLIFWFLKTMSNVFRGGWITCTKQYVGKLPIRRIEAASQAGIGRVVNQITKANEAALSAKTGREKTIALRQITALENRIDELVYKVYELTEQEVALVETSPAISAPSIEENPVLLEKEA